MSSIRFPKVLSVIFLCILCLILTSQSVAAEPTCWECNLSYQKGGGTDVIVNVQDLNLFINYLTCYSGPIPYVILSTNPYFDPIFDLNGDNIINISDLNCLVNFVNNNRTGSLWVVNCITCGC